jgi:putative transposase
MWKKCLAMRGIELSYETVREWCLKFGQTYANDLRRRSPRPGDRWHLDEVFLKLRMATSWTSRSRATKKEAARKFFRKLLKTLRYVHVCITDKLRSCSAAKGEVLPSVVHLEQKYQNNRAENSHQPTRLREKVMRRFKSADHAQRFLSAFGIITSHFRVGRHLYSASGYREVMKLRLAIWKR